MEVDDIENKIACNELTAAQVFTQMKQHIKESKCPLIGDSESGANVPFDRLVMKPCPHCRQGTDLDMMPCMYCFGKEYIKVL